ncbi:serine hydrolase domain-containing protein [Microbacterium capsulatum]|uniref:Serine hydrolase domain-containing protein n=1 Tax=Microbacterium capsulatum TaxID=3041921 RepID=A0ABU0XHJ2_9MICO|nr:serine hydrolase domain-containing protein [Microbacterium sp. ASV81]MDQ4214536.1 serine hydrolase domain-containing protein [Microbacterium sp. ASV81]
MTMTTIRTDDLTSLLGVLDERVPALLDELQVPGVGIGLSLGGESVATGYGVTNLEHPLPVTGDTIFQVGSISKTFVGLIAAQLEAEGLLDIEAPIAPLLADLGALDPRITMRHLLTHGSGIDAQYMIGRAGELLANHADDSIAASIRHFADDALMFAPGTDFSYSGPGFMVAGAVIERITGRAWADVLRERVLVPAGMAQTFTTADEAITYRVAAPHDITDGVARLARNEGWQRGWQLPGWDVPGGGVLSTGRELMRYAAYARRRDPELGFTRCLASRGVPGQEVGYAWMREHRRGRAAFGHDGLTIGYASRFRMIPEDDFAYAILSNSVKGKRITRALEAVLLEARYGAEERVEVAPFDAETHRDLVGRYDCGFYGQVDLRVREDRRAFELISLPAARQDGTFTIDPLSSPWLLPRGESVLSSDPGVEDPEQSIAYVRDGSGAVTALRIGDRIARRVEAV